MQQRTPTFVQPLVLLKARPTSVQLEDRLAEPRPAGLELYLDRQDLAENPNDLAARARVNCPTTFRWIVEAPIRTLGGQYFDLTNDDEDHRETLRRVVAVGQALHAVAANVHVVAPTLDPTRLSADERRRCLDRTASLLREYVRWCADANLLPQVENVPPVGRMRESAYVYSSIGADPADLLALAAAQPVIRFTVDTSHAGLYLNWCRLSVDPRFEDVAAFYRRSYQGEDLTGFCDRLGEFTTTVHVSNASGHFGEGDRYAEGDFCLDDALRPLLGRVPFFVTETLEPDPDRATGMRDTQVQLNRLIASTSSGPRRDTVGAKE